MSNNTDCDAILSIAITRLLSTTAMTIRIKT